MPCSRAMRRTSGELRSFSPVAAFGVGVGVGRGGVGAGTGLGLGTGLGDGLGLGERFGRRLGSFGCLRLGLCGSGRRSGGSCAIGADGGHHGLNRHSLPFTNLDFLQNAGGRRGNLGVHLVRRNFEQRFVALDFVARLFQPLGNGSFENAFAHLGHDHVDCHWTLLCVSNSKQKRAGLNSLRKNTSFFSRSSDRDRFWFGRPLGFSCESLLLVLAIPP